MMPRTAANGVMIPMTIPPKPPMPTILALAAAALACWGPVARADAPGEAIDRLLHNLPDKRATCAALVVDLATGESVYARAENRKLLPASNQKLLVMACAVHMFDESGAYRTQLARHGDDLVLVGDGDPGLGDRTLAEHHNIEPTRFIDDWASALTRQGHTSIAGDLVVDASILDQQFVHPSWEAADLLKWYGAPVGGLNFNDNCVELTVWPGRRPGTDAVWSAYPPCSLMTVTNRCKSAVQADREVPLVTRRAESFEMVLSGRVSRRSTLQSISVPNPNRFAATAIREQLAAKGIEIAGRLRFETVRTPDGKLPTDFVPVAEHVTPLPDVLQRVGIDSQNMFAEALLKRLGYEWAKQQADGRATGSWANGQRAIGEMLQHAGCDPSSIAVVDGSGLSRDNRITATALVRVLSYMFQHPRRDMFVQSLAGNRTGGRLRNRLADVKGDVYAKTGYMRGVRTLSGYVKTPDDRWYAFSVLFNGFRGSSGPFNKIHTRICRILADS